MSTQTTVEFKYFLTYATFSTVLIFDDRLVPGFIADIFAVY